MLVQPAWITVTCFAGRSLGWMLAAPGRNGKRPRLKHLLCEGFGSAGQRPLLLRGMGLLNPLAYVDAIAVRIGEDECPLAIFFVGQ